MNGQRAPRPWSVAVNKRGGRFVVDVSLPEAGKRRVYRKKFMARRSADDLANAIRVRLGEGKTPFETAEEAAPAVTVVGVVDLYATREGGQTSRALQHRSAFLKTALGARPAEEFALADLEGYIRERQPVSAATCAKDFRHLKAALAYAKAKDRISVHYFEKLAGDKVTRRRLIPAYRPEDSTGKAIPPEHFEAIVANLHHDARRAVVFARTTGCRLREVAALNWQKHFEAGRFRPIVQKGSKTRLVANDATLLGPRGIGLVFSELGATGEGIYHRLQSKWRYAVKRPSSGRTTASTTSGTRSAPTSRMKAGRSTTSRRFSGSRWRWRACTDTGTRRSCSLRRSTPNAARTLHLPLPRCASEGAESVLSSAAANTWAVSSVG